MSPKNPIRDLTSDLEYEVKVMYGLLQLLPEEMATPIIQQFAKVTGNLQVLLQLCSQLAKKGQASADKVSGVADDIRLHIKSLQFDLEATRNERDELKRKLDELQ